MNLYKAIIIETMKGKSLGRILFNYELKFLKANGKILDLGSGKVKPSYYRFINIAEDSEIITVNISTKMKLHLLTDLEKTLHFKGNNYIFIFNLLEHFNYGNILNESYRVLKQNGKLYRVVPFLASVHGDPHDYSRYTEAALSRMLKEANFKRNIEIKILGSGPFTAAYSQIQSYIPKILRVPFIFLCIFIDRFIKDKCFHLGYLLFCEKWEAKA